jgi:hypothetical protein
MRLGLAPPTVAAKIKEERKIDVDAPPTVAAKIKEERKIDVEGEIDAAEGATNKAIELY